MLSSIKMSLDLFEPSTTVQTSIYVLKAHIPHDFEKSKIHRILEIMDTK